MSFPIQYVAPSLKRKGITKLYGGVMAIFYFTKDVVGEGQPMKIKAVADGSLLTPETTLTEMVKCVHGQNDGPNCIGFAAQVSYDDTALTGQMAQLRNYHFTNDTAVRIDGQPMGLLTGMGWAMLLNYEGVVAGEDQLAIGENGLLVASDAAGVEAGDLVPVVAETAGEGQKNAVRVRYNFPLVAAVATPAS